MATYRGDDNPNTFRGTVEDDLIYGLGSDDNLRGNDGDDTIYGDDGNDFLYGQGGDDLLFGGAGDDILRSSVGVDRFNGGTGIDRISFYTQGLDGVPTRGVIVDLERQLILDDGFGNREKMTSIEAIGATLPYADILRGSRGDDILWGGDGDTIAGFGGNDQFLVDGVVGLRLDGGEGIDTLSFAAAKSFFNDEGFLDSMDSAEGVVVDLSRGLVVNDGYGGTARVRGIENLQSNRNDDRLTGSDVANRLESYEGDDRLNGQGGDDTLVGGTGRDLLTGGSGADTFVFNGYGNSFSAFVQDVEVFFRDDPDSGATFKEADVIADFSRAEGDKIDLSGVDAIALSDISASPDDEAFTWLGTGRFTGAAGEARYDVRNGNTFIYLEVNGEAGVDMVIRLDGVHALAASDFVL